VISFTTTDHGWNDIANGSLVQRPSGIWSDEWHAALVESYDLSNDWSICKNSWGDRTARPRFNLVMAALHDFYITQVYFTTDSIAGKTECEFIPRFFGSEAAYLKGHPIKKHTMDKLTAIYTDEYICEPKEDGNDVVWIGYPVCEYIRIMRNAPAHTKLEDALEYAFPMTLLIMSAAWKITNKVQ
jgi:hypothetical protein